MIDNRQGILIMGLQRFRLRTNLYKAIIYSYTLFFPLKTKHAVTFRILSFEFAENKSNKSKLLASVG